uniref:Large ribosomal subunit protein mL38 n=1 Tax=Ciona savignyi TaxID=51511 RepID=H2YIE3_CIOSA
MNRKDRGRERAARLRNLTLDIDATMDAWEDSAHSVHEVHRVAHHYNVFRDLFGHAHFYPTLRMSVEYDTPDGTANPVYYGNELSPGETPTPPDVTYPTTSDKLWSLLLVNLDGNFEDNERELVHWLVGNIQGNDVGSGETLVDYLPPLPIRGTGYHRMVFLLFQQSGTINFSSERRSSPCDSLSERSFRTRDFYRTFEDSLVPMSLRFYQCRWDESVREVFQSRLDIAEPIYEFIPNDVDRLGQLKKFPEGKTLTWLKNFMPKEPIYPSGGQFT